MVEILKRIIEVKREYEKKFGGINYSFEEGTCIENWVKELNIPLYINIFKNLNSRQYGNYVIFKYLKNEVIFTREDISYSEFWDMYNGIYRDCRGITIDVEKECLVTRPFSKFFNINEMPETQENIVIDKYMHAKRAEFGEKLDGSLVITRYYDGDVFVSSSGMADEDNDIVKFAKGIIKNNENYYNFIKDYSDYTPMFESISLRDPHIVVYKKEEEGIYLIGMRHVETGEYVMYSDLLEIARKYKLNTTSKYNTDLKGIMSLRKCFKASEKEGFVLNADNFLVKIKCDDYMLLHRVSGTKCSKNNIVKAVYLDSIDDVRASVPEAYLPILEETLDNIYLYCKLMEEEENKYWEIAPKERVEFFKWIKTVPSYLQRYLSLRYTSNSEKKMSYLVSREVGPQSSFYKYEEILNIIKKIKASRE